MINFNFFSKLIDLKFILHENLIVSLRPNAI